MIPATEREPQPLSETLQTAIYQKRVLTPEQQAAISGLSEVIGKHDVTNIALARRSLSGSLRLHVYLGVNADVGPLKQQLADARDALGVELNLMFPNLHESTPEQIRKGLERIYDNPFSGWRLISSGQIQTNPFREPNIVLAGDYQAASSLPKTTSKTC